MAVVAAVHLILFLSVTAQVQPSKLGLLPFGVSEKCLLFIYTYRIDAETTEWIGAGVREASAHNIPIMAFAGPEKSPQRLQQGDYIVCNLFFLFNKNRKSVKKYKIPIVRSPQRLTDFVILILNLTADFKPNQKDAIISPAQAPENMLILVAQYDKQGLPLKFHALYVYTKFTTCRESSYQAIQLDNKLEISQTTPALLPKVNFNSYRLLVTIWGNKHFDRRSWEFLKKATMRELYTMHIRISEYWLSWKEVADVCERFNLTPVTTFRKRLKYFDNRFPALVFGETDMRESLVDFGEYSRRGSLTQTFLYCTRKVDAYARLLSIFYPLDRLTWVFLVAIVLSLLIQLKFLYHLKPLTALLAVLSPLISQATPSDAHKPRRVLLLWSFITSITAWSYTGAIGSLLVVPPTGRLLKTFQDLAENRYWIQLRGNRSSTYNLFARQNKPNGSFRYNRHLSTLLRQYKIAPEDHRVYLGHLASTSHSAAMNVNLTIEAYLSFLKKYHENAECHKGEEVLHIAGGYEVFVPPYNDLLKRAFDRFLSSGINKNFERLKDSKRLEKQMVGLRIASEGRNLWPSERECLNFPWKILRAVSPSTGH